MSDARGRAGAAMGAKPHALPCPGTVPQEGWAGRSELPVAILRETPKRYEVRFRATAYRFCAGQVRLVPKESVSFTVTEDEQA